MLFSPLQIVRLLSSLDRFAHELVQTQHWFGHERERALKHEDSFGLSQALYPALQHNHLKGAPPSLWDIAVHISKKMLKESQIYSANGRGC